MHRPLTGRKVLLMFIGAFGVIIGANLALIYAAMGSFPGLNVKNTYVESQGFDLRKDAQIALGWQSDLVIEGNQIILQLRDRAGAPARVQTVELRLGLAATSISDQMIQLEYDDGAFHGRVPDIWGRLLAQVTAVSPHGVSFEQSLDIYRAQP